MSRRRVIAGIALFATSAAVSSATLATAPAAGASSALAGALPWPSAQVTATAERPAPGVEVRTLSISVPGARPSWTVTVQAPAVDDVTGAAQWADLGDAAWARRTVAQLAAAGVTARTDQVPWPAYSDTPHGIEGDRVRAGTFATQAEAQSQAAAIAATGLHPVVEWTGYDAGAAPDHEIVRVGVVDPARFRGQVVASHGAAVAGRSTTSAQARSAGSALAVNGGFFITSDADGVQGTQSGLAVYRGSPAGQSAGARAALVLGDGGRHIRIANLVSRAVVRDGRSSFPVGGIDRMPGKVRDCGRPGVSPTVRPRQDVTCTAVDDMVLFTPDYGAPLPAGPATQVTLDGAGRVTAAGAAGGTVPAGGRVLQGIGAAATWLRDHAVLGRRLGVAETISDTAGHRVVPTAETGIVSAAPLLLRGGRPHIDAAAEGVVDPADLAFGYAWAQQRQPRTLAGLDRNGRLLLVTVDGRRSGGSEGVTIEEAAGLMRALGAVDALNLDGGGSTTMAIEGRLVNAPSDATGERPVGDTVQVIPAA